MNKALQLLKLLETSSADLWSKLLPTLDSKKFYKNWGDELGSRRSDWWESIGAESEDDPNMDQLLQDAFDSRMQEWENDLHDELEIQDGKLKLYRCIAIKDVDKFVKSLQTDKPDEALGIYWSWDEKAAECHWSKGGTSVKVVGLADLNSVDIARTADANMDLDIGQNEKEIRLKEGTKVKVLYVNHHSINKIIAA